MGVSGFLRRRSRRVRHRLLRQALEVPPLPGAHDDPQQPRVRPRGHLSRPRRDRDAVPPFRAHAARERAHRRERRRRGARAGPGARLLHAGRALRRRRRLERGRARQADGFEVSWQGAGAGPRAMVARRARTTGRTRSRPSPRRATAGSPRAQAIAALATFESVKRRMEVRGVGERRHGLRRFRAPSDRDRDDARGPARGGRRRPDRLRAGAALEHDEAGLMKERLAASLAGSDLVFCYSAGLAWDARAVLAPLGARRSCTTTSTSSSRAVAAASRPGRPRARHEQRRLRRHTRETAERCLPGTARPDQEPPCPSACIACIGQESSNVNEIVANDKLGAFCRHTHIEVKGAAQRAARGPHLRGEGHLRHRRRRRPASAAPTGCARTSRRRARRPRCSCCSTPARTSSARRTPRRWRGA